MAAPSRPIRGGIRSRSRRTPTTSMRPPTSRRRRSAGTAASRNGTRSTRSRPARPACRSRRARTISTSTWSRPTTTTRWRPMFLPHLTWLRTANATRDEQLRRHLEGHRRRRVRGLPGRGASGCQAWTADMLETYVNSLVPDGQHLSRHRHDLGRPDASRTPASSPTAPTRSTTCRSPGTSSS